MNKCALGNMAVQTIIAVIVMFLTYLFVQFMRFLFHIYVKVLFITPSEPDGDYVAAVISLAMMSIAVIILFLFGTWIHDWYKSEVRKCNRGIDH